MLFAPGPPRHEQKSAAQKLFFTVTIASLLAASVTASASARLYSSRSPLNTPIASTPATHPNSDAMIQKVLTAAGDGGFRLSLQQWSVPIYTANRSTPRHRVRLTADWAPRRAMLRVPIPSRAAPDPQGDGHMAIIDRRRGCEWDFWQAKKGANGWSASWGNRIRTTSRGIFRRGLSARASGFALGAGVIFPGEMARRRIKHALVFAYPHVRTGGPVRPATQSDGEESGRATLPMGARLQLRPGLNLRALNLAPWQLAVARALKRYGMFLGDTGGTVAIRAVSPQSYVQNPYGGALRRSPTVSLPLALIKNMRVLRFGPQYSIRSRVLRSRCARMR